MQASLRSMAEECIRWRSSDAAQSFGGQRRRSGHSDGGSGRTPRWAPCAESEAAFRSMSKDRAIFRIGAVGAGPRFEAPPALASTISSGASPSSAAGTSMQSLRGTSKSTSPSRKFRPANSPTPPLTDFRRWMPRRFTPPARSQSRNSAICLSSMSFVVAVDSESSAPFCLGALTTPTIEPPPGLGAVSVPGPGGGPSLPRRFNRRFAPRPRAAAGRAARGSRASRRH
mmetsp:Transcript_19493/g.44158  ORF Transcript_19493/g.44158 Transcript_19493/m.44158 type:complete len:228 (-) Transcript_19493:85-768(-)